MALVRMDGRARASEKAAEAICSSFDFVQVAYAKVVNKTAVDLQNT